MGKLALGPVLMSATVQRVTEAAVALAAVCTVSLGQSLPRLAGIRTTRTTTDALDVRETPRLRVDKLKGNVFVNQYLVIKDLGRGAHGTVKLVFDTEQQAVYAMKVIHRKGPNKSPANARRNSYSAGSPYGASPAHHSTVGTVAQGLIRGYSMSVDTSSAEEGISFSAGSFSAGTHMGRQLQPLLSVNGLGNSTSGNGSRPLSSQGLQQQQCQHIIQEGRSCTASSVGFRSSPGVMQHSGDGLQSTSTEGQSPQLAQQQADGSGPTSFLLSWSSPDATEQQHEEKQQDNPRTPSASIMSLAEAAVAAGIAPLSSLTGAAATDKEHRASELNASAPYGSSLGTETIPALPVDSLAVLSTDTVAQAAPLHAAADSSNTASVMHPVPSLLNTSIRPYKPSHQHQLSLDSSSTVLNSTAAAMASSFTVGTRGPMPIAGAAADAQTAELMREMAVMKKLDHPHVVALYEVIHDPDAKLLIMVMEFMPGGPLLSSTGHGNTEPIPEAAARGYFRELISGLDYLHYNLIIHGDLKPDNLLLSAEGRLKISDFGSSTVLPSADALVSSTPGTPAFMAPEMCGLRSEPYNPFSAECWALGVCLFMFVYGRIPYSAPSMGLLYERIRSPQPVELPSQPVVSVELQQLLRGLLDKCPAARLTLDQVCCHDWVTDRRKLPPVVRCCQQEQQGVASLAGSGVTKAEQKNAITALKKQVKEAIPSVEERIYKKGQVLLQQGKVPEGLFLILHGECELVITNVLQEPAGPNSTAESFGVQLSGPSVAAIRKDVDMDFAEHLSSSSTGSDDADEDADDSMGDGSYSPLARSYNRNTVHILQAAMAAVASTGNTAVGSDTVQSQQGTYRSAGDAAAGMSASDPAAELASPEDILPQLLPPPRWGTASSDDSRQALGTVYAGHIPHVANVAAVVGRGFAKSAGPVLSLGATVNTALVAQSDQHGKMHQSSSPCYAPVSRRPMSVTVDVVDLQVLGPRASFDSTASLKDYRSSYIAARPSSLALSPRLCSTTSNPIPANVLAAFKYPRISQSSLPDLQQLLHSPRGVQSARPGSAGAAAYPDVWPGSPSGVVQRSASSATMGKVLNRAVRRSESMHRRMKLLVDQAKSITEHNTKRQELVGIRGPGQVVGDTSLGSRALPATATVRARTRMKVLVVRRADAAVLRHQPIIKAALLRTQTESSVLETLESFVTYDTEVTAIDELRKTLAAASQSLGCSPLSESYSLAAGAQVHMLAIANGAAGGDAGLLGSFSGPAGSLGKLMMTAGTSPGGGGSGTYPADGSDEGLSGSSSLAAGTHPSIGSAYSFSAVAAAISGRSSPDYSQCPVSPRRTLTPGHVTPPTAFGLSGNSSHTLLGSSVLPSRVSSSSRFALGAANGSQPHSLQISPMPSVTAGVFGGPGKNCSQRSMAV